LYISAKKDNAFILIFLRGPDCSSID